MDREAELAVVRHAYAKQILAMAGVTDPRLCAAFARVRRERFVGPGPWQMLRGFGGHATTPDADPVYLYTNQPVGLISERDIHNGVPVLHATLLAAAGIHDGAHVVHVGAGTGYYSAIMAVLAGPAGRLAAIEYDPELASRARGYLADFPNVTVIQGNGTTITCDAVDVIYVNAGVTHPANAWLDGLADGGRLLLPLTTDENFPRAPSSASAPPKITRTGFYFWIRRRGTAFDARCLCPVVIIPAEGARNETAEAALAAALHKGGCYNVTRLVRGAPPPDEESCWLRGDGWCLACD